jgi:hypothetical protein
MNPEIYYIPALDSLIVVFYPKINVAINVIESVVENNITYVTIRRNYFANLCKKGNVVYIGEL